MLSERSTHILEAAINEFIKTGEPISSGWLFRNYDFGIRPAMIRWELKDLTDQGYLTQPNYSAGRVPTDKGYEFIVSYALRGAEPGIAERRLAELLAERSWNELLGKVSNMLGVMSAVYADEEVRKTGLERLIEHFDWNSRKELMDVIHDFEALDERLEGSKQEIENGTEDIKAFIGKSPITHCSELTVMAGKYNVDGDEVLFFTIGPKRMNYEKTVRILKALQNHGEY